MRHYLNFLPFGFYLLLGFISCQLAAEDHKDLEVLLQENRVELLLAFENLEESWGSQKLSVSCENTIFRIEKSAFGRKSLHRIKNSKWVEVKGAVFDGFEISWEEPEKVFELGEISENVTECSDIDNKKLSWREKHDLKRRCLLDLNKRIFFRNQFADIFIKNYSPNIKRSDFSKFFKITSSSKINNRLSLDRAYYSRYYLESPKKISVTVLEGASNRPEKPNRVTRDKYRFKPIGDDSGFCKQIKN